MRYLLKVIFETFVTTILIKVFLYVNWGRILKNIKREADNIRKQWKTKAGVEQ